MSKSNRAIDGASSHKVCDARSDTPIGGGAQIKRNTKKIVDNFSIVLSNRIYFMLQVHPLGGGKDMSSDKSDGWDENPNLDQEEKYQGLTIEKKNSIRNDYDALLQEPLPERLNDLVEKLLKVSKKNAISE